MPARIGAIEFLDPTAWHRFMAEGWVSRMQHGIKPAPDRPTPWRTFLKAHADVIGAADFFTTEVWTPRGLVTYYRMFVIDIATRAVHVAGTTRNPDARFMAQIARNLTDCVDGFLRAKQFLIVDRDGKFPSSKQF